MKEDKYNIIDEVVRSCPMSKQLCIAIEELGELQQELLKILRYGVTDKEPLIDEIADVLIVVEQIRRYMNLDSYQISSQVEFKIKRLRNRFMNNKLY